MQFHEKLFKLRKKAGLTQAELAEELNVSRQAISKWEMGTATPDVTNMLALSKTFNVTMDYLANDNIETEKDIPLIKATEAVLKISFKYVLSRVIIAICIISIVSIVAVTTHSFVSISITLMFIGVVYIISILMRLLIIHYSNKK